jgi:cell division protein FtsQ
MKAAPRRRRRSAFFGRVCRFGLWVGVPVLLAGGLCGAVLLSRSPLGQAALQYTADRMLDGSARLGLVVGDIKVEGRETTDRETILTALGAAPGTPILAMSPKRAKEQLETLPWVRSAVVERRLPDTLYVRLVGQDRSLWRHGGKLELMIDREGAVIPVAISTVLPSCRWSSARSAASHAADLLSICWRPSRSRLAGQRRDRVGDRRWNLRIDNAIDVLLRATRRQRVDATRPTGAVERYPETRRAGRRCAPPDRLVLRVNRRCRKSADIKRDAHRREYMTATDEAPPRKRRRDRGDRNGGQAKPAPAGESGRGAGA